MDFYFYSFLNMMVAIETVIKINDNPVLKIKLRIHIALINLFDTPPVKIISGGDCLK